MDLNNRGEVTCVGQRGKVLGRVTHDPASPSHLLRVVISPCDGSEPIGPAWDWADLLPDLCRRVCGKCPGRRQEAENTADPVEQARLAYEEARDAVYDKRAALKRAAATYREAVRAYDDALRKAEDGAAIEAEDAEAPHSPRADLIGHTEQEYLEHAEREADRD